MIDSALSLFMMATPAGDALYGSNILSVRVATAVDGRQINLVLSDFPIRWIYTPKAVTTDKKGYMG